MSEIILIIFIWLIETKLEIIIEELQKNKDAIYVLIERIKEVKKCKNYAEE